MWPWCAIALACVGVEPGVPTPAMASLRVNAELASLALWFGLGLALSLMMFSSLARMRTGGVSARGGLTWLWRILSDLLVTWVAGRPKSGQRPRFQVVACLRRNGWEREGKQAALGITSTSSS